MPASDKETLGAKSKFSVALDPASPTTFTHIPTVLGFGEVGSEGELVQTTPIHLDQHTYIAGMQDGSEQAVVMNDIPGNADHESFCTKAREKATVPVRIEYTNGRTAQYDLVLTGFAMEEATHSDQLKCGVKGKISGEITWGVAA